MVDELILYDDCQYTKRDWRNSNKIKTQNGSQWLTIPVEVKGKYQQKIKDTVISDPEWSKKHWSAIKYNYSKAAFFKYHIINLILLDIITIWALWKWKIFYSI